MAKLSVRGLQEGPRRPRAPKGRQRAGIKMQGAGMAQALSRRNQGRPQKRQGKAKAPAPP